MATGLDDEKQTELETEKQAVSSSISGTLSALHAKVAGNPSAETLRTNIANAIAGVSTFKRMPADRIDSSGQFPMTPVSTGTQNGALLDNALDQANASGGKALEKQMADEGMQALARMKPWNSPVSSEVTHELDFSDDPLGAIVRHETPTQQTNEFGEKFKILAAHGGDPTPVYDAVLKGGADLKVRDLMPFNGLKGTYAFPNGEDTAAVLPTLNPALASKLIDALVKTESVNPDLDRPHIRLDHDQSYEEPDFASMAPGVYDPNDRQALQILLQAGGKPSQAINLDSLNDFGNSPGKVYASRNPLLIAAALGMPANAPCMGEIIQKNAELPAGQKATDEQIFYTLAKYGHDPKTYVESGFDADAMNAHKQTGLMQALAETARVKEFYTPVTTPESFRKFRPYLDVNKKDATGQSPYDYLRTITNNLADAEQKDMERHLYRNAAGKIITYNGEPELTGIGPANPSLKLAEIKGILWDNNQDIDRPTSKPAAPTQTAAAPVKKPGTSR